MKPKRFNHLGFWMTAVPLVVLALAIAASEPFSAVAWLSWAGFLVVSVTLAWRTEKLSRADQSDRQSQS